MANHGRAKAVAADLAHALAYGTSYRLSASIRRKPDDDPEWMLWDFVRYNFLPVKR